MSKKYFVFLVLLLSTNYVNADCSGNSCNSVYVDLLYVRASGDVSVGTSGTETGLNCTPGGTNGVYLKLYKSDLSSDFIYSTLLAAQMANRQVKIRISEGSSDCHISYITLAR